MKPLVLYHGSCVDGFTAAWAAWRRFKDTADYKAVQYGQDPPDVTEYDVVYILDFSYPIDVLEKMQRGTKGEYFTNVYVLDHHKSAEEQLKDFPGAIFDMTHSGAYLAWQRFQPEYEVPALVRYVEDRDLWKWELPHSREISAAIASYLFEFDVWDELDVRLEAFINNRHYLVQEGDAILRYQKQQIGRICSHVDLHGYIGGHRKIPTVNSCVLQSEVGEELLRRYPEAPFVGVYYMDNNKIRWSLRSRGDFDVSEIAKQYGGGGHRAAAGFEENLQ